LIREIEVKCICAGRGNEHETIMAEIADQDQRWGEERSVEACDVDPE
jgi:hypothetical protein